MRGVVEFIVKIEVVPLYLLAPLTDAEQLKLLGNFGSLFSLLLLFLLFTSELLRCFALGLQRTGCLARRILATGK